LVERCSAQRRGGRLAKAPATSLAVTVIASVTLTKSLPRLVSASMCGVITVLLACSASPRSKSPLTAAHERQPLRRAMHTRTAQRARACREAMDRSSSAGSPPTRATRHT
jgi:hypothetical protein